jgi:hypothetical protein
VLQLLEGAQHALSPDIIVFVLLRAGRLSRSLLAPHHLLIAMVIAIASALVMTIFVPQMRKPLQNSSLPDARSRREFAYSGGAIPQRVSSSAIPNN